MIPSRGLRGRRRGGCGSRRAAEVVDSLDGGSPGIRPQGHRPPADDIRPASWWHSVVGRRGRARRASSAHPIQWWIYPQGGDRSV